MGSVQVEKKLKGGQKAKMTNFVSSIFSNAPLQLVVNCKFQTIQS